MAQKGFTIGWLADRTQCKVQTIRYYEQIGLMPKAPRSEGNRRLYGNSQADRLAFIRHSRELGFSLDQIRELLTLSDDAEDPCVEIDAIASSHLGNIRDKISRLQGLESELVRVLNQCDGHKVSDCRIIEVLSDHKLCVADNH